MRACSIKDWRAFVHGKLRIGLGSEDIAAAAHRAGICQRYAATRAEMISEEIKQLRQEGALLAVLGIEGKK